MTQEERKGEREKDRQMETERGNSHVPEIKKNLITNVVSAWTVARTEQRISDMAVGPNS